jgi:RNA ligase
MDFNAFPKLHRLSRLCVITEKLDGTNAQICIGEDGEFQVGSRTRWITPENDNHGFAKWAYANKEELLTLGPGRHFGEWWGNGIQRGYNLKNGDKRFSLFNTVRWCPYGEVPKPILSDNPSGKMQEIAPSCCGVVPVLYSGLFTTEICEAVLYKLGVEGSVASPGFSKPEGIVVFHIAANTAFKKTLENDGLPKSLVKG